MSVKTTYRGWGMVWEEARTFFLPPSSPLQTPAPASSLHMETMMAARTGKLLILTILRKNRGL